jgi:uncharacterized protein YggE
MPRRSFVLALLCALVSANAALAQDVPTPGPRGPEIVAAGEGIRSVPADRASVIVAVETRAGTPSEASALNAARNNAVRAAIAAVGVPREDIATAPFGYSVYPLRQEPYTRETGYVANNSVRVLLRRPEHLALVGRVIDTALTAGATHIAGVRYEARRTSEAEREALAEAVADARSRAEAVARAAGGSLGELLQVITQSMPGVVATAGMDLSASMMRAAAARGRMEPTSVNAGEIEVRQYVTARWRFVPGQR